MITKYSTQVLASNIYDFSAVFPIFRKEDLVILVNSVEKSQSNGDYDVDDNLQQFSFNIALQSTDTVTAYAKYKIEKIVTLNRNDQFTAYDFNQNNDHIYAVLNQAGINNQISTLLPTLDTTKNYTLLFRNNQLDAIEVPLNSDIKDKLLIGTEDANGVTSYIAITFDDLLKSFLAKKAASGSGYVVSDRAGNVAVVGGGNSGGTGGATNANNPIVPDPNADKPYVEIVGSTGNPDYKQVSAKEILDKAITSATNDEFVKKTANGYTTEPISSNDPRILGGGKTGQILEWDGGQLKNVDKAVATRTTLAELQADGIIPNKLDDAVLGWDNAAANQLTNIPISSLGGNTPPPVTPTDIPVEISAGVIGDGIQLSNNGQNLYTTAGFARFVERTNPKEPLAIDVDIPQVAATLSPDQKANGKTLYPYLLWNKATKTATLEVQEARPTFTDRITSLRLYVGYARTSNLNVFETFSEPTLLTAADDQIRETWKVMGGKSTAILTLNPTGRGFSQTDGILYHYGAGYSDRANTPFELKLNARKIDEFNIISSNELSSSPTITNDYDVGGTITGIDDGKFTIQRVYRYKTGALEVLLSKRQLDASEKPFAHAWDIFQEEQKDLAPTYLQEDGILEGFVIVEKAGQAQFFSIKENPLHAYYPVITATEKDKYAKVDAAGKRLEFIDPPFAKTSDIPTDFYTRAEVDSKIAAGGGGTTPSNPVGSYTLYDFPLIRYRDRFSIGNRAGSIHRQFFDQPSERIEVGSQNKAMINWIDISGIGQVVGAKQLDKLRYLDKATVKELPNDKWSVYRLLINQIDNSMSLVLPTILVNPPSVSPKTYDDIKSFVSGEAPIEPSVLESSVILMVGFCNGIKNNFINDSDGVWFNINHDTKKPEDSVTEAFYYSAFFFRHAIIPDYHIYQVINGKLTIYTYNEAASVSAKRSTWDKYHADRLDDIFANGIPYEDFFFYVSSGIQYYISLLDLKNRLIYANYFPAFNNPQNSYAGQAITSIPQFFQTTPLNNVNINADVLEKIVGIWFNSNFVVSVLVTKGYSNDAGYRTYFMDYRPSTAGSLVDKSFSIQKRVIKVKREENSGTLLAIQYENDPKIYLSSDKSNFQLEVILPNGDTLSSLDNLYTNGTKKIYLSDEGNIYLSDDSYTPTYTKLNNKTKIKKLIAKNFNTVSPWFLAVDDTDNVYYYSTIISNAAGMPVKDSLELISGGGIGKIEFGAIGLDCAILINDRNEIYGFGKNYQGSLGLSSEEQLLNSATKIPFDLNAILATKNTFVRSIHIGTAGKLGTRFAYHTIILLDNGSFVATGLAFMSGGTSEGRSSFGLMETFIDKPYVYPTAQPYTAIEEKMKEPTVELIAEEVKQLKVEIDTSKLEAETKQQEITSKQQEINLKAEELSKKIEELEKKKVPVKKVTKKK